MVSRNGANYVARSLDDGDDLALVSRDVERITQAIDQLWDGLENGIPPDWLGDSTIDLDEPSVAEHFGVAAQPRPLDSYKDKRFAQIVLALAMTAIAVPLAICMHVHLSECEPEIVFTLAVSAVAMIDMMPALLLSMFSALAFNFSIVPPESAFTMPTREEIVYFLINIMVSIAIPLLLSWIGGVRRALVRTPNT
ncbi:DUF4118 domain-containing protein [Bradyrhizobium sp. CB1650]|uniref:DUF4118 domain-containing protein n=1 Tax=Bradyrhizobium sp. CB1650 TaxID=3039153 RepID=UPI0024350951|nr:DUF4118 domain-containing protein [Bradyrhizobium sp. CB1650]WGD50742.1 DUF4118 domain-containing protein [Bradyrhizobium sp. CB1650]